MPYILTRAGRTSRDLQSLFAPRKVPCHENGLSRSERLYFKAEERRGKKDLGKKTEVISVPLLNPGSFPIALEADDCDIVGLRSGDGVLADGRQDGLAGRRDS
jgi:hypothetical protein